jgi:xylan 1,4-beta-xylosidase
VVDGDGADVLVQAWAARHDDGTLDVLVWNGTVNAELLHGDPRLVREVTVRLTGLPAASYGVEVARVDEQHSNIRAVASGSDWPDQEEWERLRAADRLHTETLADLLTRDGTGTVALTLPQPGVARIRLRAASGRSGGDQPSATDEEKN